MTNQKVEAVQLNWLNKVCLVYGAIGFVLFVQFTTNGAWKSFALGWTVAVVNLELLKRLGLAMVAVYRGENLGPMFYGVLFGKFLFWGLVIALFSTASWIQAIPFVLGSTTLLVAGLALGMKEFIYARTS